MSPSGPENGHFREPTIGLVRGSKIGRYIVLDLLGSGGMGVVYKAYDPRLNRGIALKVIKAKEGRHGDWSNRSARLLREAQALAQLNHPNVVRVHDIGTFGENVFVAMEFVAGNTVRDWYRDTKPPTARVLEVIRSAGRGLAAAHKAGLIHRDFKPDNIIVGEDGRVRVIDFGLARAGSVTSVPATVGEQKLENTKPLKTQEPIHLETLLSPCVIGVPAPQAESGSEASSGPSSSDSGFLATPLTRVGAVVGTPTYMAPEQHLGLSLDARADQFSFCAVLYEVLYGRRPFPGSSIEEYVGNIIEGRIQPPQRDENTAPWLRSVVMRGLSRQPTDRYPSMDVLLEELDRDPEEELRQLRVVKRRRAIGWSVVGGLVVVMAFVLAVRAEYRDQIRAECEAEANTIGGVWNREVGEQIAQAFAHSDVHYAKDTWSRAWPHIDVYVSRWKEAREKVCIEGELDKTRSADNLARARSCFDEQLTRLESLAMLYSSPTKTTVEKAASSAQSLPLLRTCVDETELARQRSLPSDPATVSVMKTLRKQLTRAQTFSTTGEYGKARTIAKMALSKASELDLRDIIIAANQTVGDLQDKLGRFSDARATYETAFYDADVVGDDMGALRAATGLIMMAGYRLAQHKEGEEWYRLAKTKADRLKLRKDHPAVARLIHYFAGVNYACGDFDRAEKMWKQALAIKKRALGPDHPQVSYTMTNLGTVHHVKGNHDQAEKLLRRALAIKERALGPDHPEVAWPLNNLGVVYGDKGDYEQAEKMWQRALLVREKALGPNHPDVAWPLNNLGDVYRAKEAYGRAEKTYQRALLIREKALGPNHPNLSYSLNNLGIVYANKGDYEQAEKMHQRALLIREKAFGPNHLEVARLLKDLGEIWFAQKRFGKARKVLERAVGICRKETCQPDVLGAALFSLAKVLVASKGDTEKAIELAQQARETFSKAPKNFKTELEEVNAWLQEHV